MLVKDFTPLEAFFRPILGIASHYPAVSGDYTPLPMFASSFHTVCRWSGPGMLGQEPEKLEIAAPRMAREGSIPGRSARSRYFHIAFHLLGVIRNRT